MAALAEDNNSITNGKNNVKRVRATNFNSNEVLKLEELVKNHYDVLNSKLTNQVTNNIKAQIWKDISRQVSALGYAHRSEHACSDKWANLKRKAKDEITKEKIERRKTGGGELVAVASQQSQRIGDMLAETTAFSGIQGGLDTDEQDGLNYISNLERIEEEPHQEQEEIPTVVNEKTTTCNSDQGSSHGPVAGCSKSSTLKRPSQNRLALRKQAKRSKSEILLDHQIAYFKGMVERQHLEKELMEVKLRVLKSAERKMDELNAKEMLDMISEL